MIKQSTIDHVDDLNIVDVIKKYVPDLKKSGANYIGRSPFTEEKTPSFTVSPAKYMWKCFSTGKGGKSVVKFVMELKNISYPEAIKDIAGLFNILVEFDNDERGIEAMKKREKCLDIAEVNGLALEFFQSKLREIDEKTLRLTHDEAEEMGIGYADNDFKSLYKYLIDKGVSKKAIQSASLATESDKGIFDFFNGRVIFPIYNEYNQLAGFSGRTIQPDGKPKYLNTRETELFVKSKLFLGIEKAKTNIIKESKADIVEGNYDVAALHLNKVNTAIAPCGTALTEDHVKMLTKWKVKGVRLIMDGDNAGLNAAMRSIQLLVTQGIIPELVLMPTKKDPYDVCYVDHNATPEDERVDYLTDNTTDGIEWVAARFFEGANTVAQRADAENRLERFLATISDTRIRKNYTKILAKTFKLSVADIEKNVVAKIKEMNSEDEPDKKNKYKIPAWITDEEREEFDLRGFFEDTKPNTIGYWFASQHYQLEQASNFLVKPLFHIDSFSNNRRLIEIIGKRGQFIIEVPSKGFVSVTPFQEACMEKGNFQWYGTSKQFKYVATKFMDKMPKAKEITTLGWQNDGFFSFADGIVLDGKFKRVDNYGMVTAGGDEEHYFLPAFSSIYKNFSDEDDPYQSDRALKYRPSTTTFETWAKTYHAVHGKENACLGIAHLMATLFRDIIHGKKSFFPILFHFGDVQTGKTQAAKGLNSVFLGNQQPFMLNSGTLVGFTRKLGQFKNVPVWMDEYTNDIDEKIFQGLKAVWDGAGREKGRATQDNKTKTDSVYSSLNISGQYLPTRDSNSLFTRSIILTYNVKAEQRTIDEIEKFNALAEMQSKGLSSIVLEVLKYRDLIEQEYEETEFRIMKDMKFMFQQSGIDYNGRVLGNFVVLLAVVELLEDKIKLPFTSSKLRQITMKFVEKQSEAINDSDVLQSYWKMVEFLFLQGLIKYGEDFEIELKKLDELFYADSKKTERIQFDQPKNLLYIQFKKIHPLYMTEHKKQTGQNGTNESSIRSYMKSSKPFVGVCPSHTFESIRTSAWVFDYDILQEMGIRLQVSGVTAEKPTNEKTKEDLPF
jgi:DNA primase catalytic core